MREIKNIKAREILDSRGNPTLEAEVLLSDGSIGRASVPSGASTGSLEAHELRDNDKKRYLGKGVLQAVHNVNKIIAPHLYEFNPFDQAALDQAMIKLDGSKNKSKLGANAILAISMANAKACANSLGLPLYRYIGGINSYLTPVPMMNIINGGKHADNKIDIQEFMIMPVEAKSITCAIRMGAEIFHHLRSILHKKGHNTNVGDEGGFAPNLNSPESALDYIMEAIEQAGFKAGRDVMLALDVAASELFEKGKYHLKGESKILNSQELISYYQKLINNYPIFSIEDACAENDLEGWKLLTSELGKQTQLVGDDLFATNPEVIDKLSSQNLANAVLIKINQIGTLSETLSAIALAKSRGYKTIISHRSGETEDSSIAHIAIATNAGQIKTGAPCRTDRVAKYNELIRIEEELGIGSSYAQILNHK